MTLRTVITQELDIQKQRYSYMMKLLSAALAFISILTSCLLIASNAPIELVAAIMVTAGMYLFLHFTFRASHLRAGFYGLLYLSSLNSLTGIILIGWRSGIYVLLLLLIPVLFYNPLIKRTEKILLCVFYGALIASTILLGFLIDPPIHFNILKLQILNSFNVLATFLVLAGISYLDFRNSNVITAKLVDLNNQLAYQASKDSLTDLLNRRTMNQMIQMEFVRSTRSGKPFGLIMADVDDFKQVNDEHGHAAGDLVLTELAGLLSSSLRKQDLTARWGGEEFLILLPETDFEGVQVTAEKVRDLVSSSSFSFQEKLIQVTLSMGGVVCQGQEDWDNCIKQADRALYYGKKHGKNMAIFSKGEIYCILGEITDSFTQRSDTAMLGME